MTSIPQKTCVHCEKPFPATLKYFYSDKPKKDGLSPRCKQCHKIGRKPRAIPPKGYKHCPACGYDLPATLENFYPTISIYCPSGLHTYCIPCCGKRRLIAWDRKLEREGKVRRPRRKGEGTDLKKRREYEKRWFQEGGNEIVKANTRNRRARLRQAEGHHTAKDIRKQYELQKGKCYYCQSKVGIKYHVDHVIPVTRGGSNYPSNLVISCSHCNESKNNRLPHEWFEGGRLM